MPFPAFKQVGTPEFSEGDVTRLHKYIKERVRYIDEKLDTFRKVRLPKYVRTYKGIPKNKDVSFPWEGASNLVVQLAATFADELVSRIMAIYMSDPLFAVSLSGDTISKDGEDMKLVTEKFLSDMALNPMEVDLYRKQQAMFGSATKFGTGILDLNWEYQVEQQYNHIAGGESDESPVVARFNDLVIRDGPFARQVPLNKFGIDPRDSSLEDSSFFYTIRTLNFWQLSDLPGKSSLYKKEDIEAIKKKPDRDFPDQMQQEIEQAQGFEDMSQIGSAEWDIYTCYLKYQVKNKTYSIIAKYHKMSETFIYEVYNIYPKNFAPIEAARLAYDEDSFWGVGYMEMLDIYQTEMSKNLNWRANNRNLAMLGILVVDPGSKLSSILNVYPGVMIPAKKDEVNLLKPGADVGYNDGPDQFIMALAKERAGVDPAIGGTGGGLVNNKRGIYSASGTSIVMAQQNNRNQLRLGDMRMSHMRIGDKLLAMYAHFGIGDRLKKYGDQAETLAKALEAYKNGTLGLSVRAATSSNNKELERQNDILLAGQLSKHWQEQAQMIQAMVQPGAPPQLTKFYGQCILAARALQKSILRNFNHTNISSLLPEVPDMSQPQQGAQNGNSGVGSPQATIEGAIPTGGVSPLGQVPR